MNVTVVPNGPCGCPPGRPPKPPVPNGDIVHYEDNVTDFITASPDMGVVLRTESGKVTKLHKGSLVRDLVYVDKSMQLQTITGVLSAVLCKIDEPKKPVGNCPPPPCAPEVIRPVILVLDVSTEYDAAVFKIPISSIRDFFSDEIDPSDIRVWDIDFISDTQVIFYSKFEPKIVRWNDSEVEFSETRGNVEGATRYLITINSVRAENVLTVIGTGGAIVTRSVVGIPPEVHDTFTTNVVLTKVNELIKNYFNVTANDSGVTIPQKELYVNILGHCHGVDDILITDKDDNPVWVYGPDDIIPFSLGMNSFSYQEIAKQSGDVLMMHAPMLLYLIRRMVADGYKLWVNGFNIIFDLPTDDVWNTPMVASNVLVYGGSDERNAACVCNDTITLTRYDGTCGVSFILSNKDGDKMPAGTDMITAARDISEEDLNGKISALSIIEARDDDLITTALYVGYTTEEITEDSDRQIAYDVIAPDFGSVTLKVRVITKTE